MSNSVWTTIIPVNEPRYDNIGNRRDGIVVYFDIFWATFKQARYNWQFKIFNFKQGVQKCVALENGVDVHI